MSNDVTVELEPDLPDPADSEGEFLDPVMKPFNPSDIDIVVEPKSLDALIERLRHDELDMSTEFQRHPDLWDNGKMSRLIESILIRFPLPAFYFDASDEQKWLIVDGLQRLSSIRKFVIDKQLKLTGLEFLTELNGRKYDDLHRTYQRRINEYPVTVYMIKPGTPADVKYSIFRRINTGGMTLTNQEIRNAMAKSEDRKFLKKIAAHRYMLETMGDLSARMMDQELVLRFWAFYNFDYFDPKNKKAIAPFIDKAMEGLKSSNQQHRQEFEDAFDRAITRCYNILGEMAFEKPPAEDGRRKRKNTTLFEVWMVTLAKLSDEEFKKLQSNKDLFEKKRLNLFQDIDFSNAITYATQKEIHVKIRYEKVDQLIREVLNA